jgi:hypothetical protein
MNKVCLFLTITVLLSAWSCQPKKQEYKKVFIENINIKTKLYNKIDRKRIDGYILGSDFNRNLLFLRELLPVNKNHIIKLIDITNGKDVQSIPLKAGDFQSPDEFSEPTRIQFINDNYYIFDHNDKIVVFDKSFRRLYSNMIQGSRYFLDFYNNGKNIHFLLGKSKINRKDQTCHVLLYHLEHDKRPVLDSEIFKTHHPSAWSLHDKKHYYVGHFWSNSWGFEKDGRIYYSDNREGNYYTYDIKSGEIVIFQLSYLKEKSFSESDAQKFGNYKNPLWPKKMRRKVVYIVGKQPVFHFGIFDVGNNKIGVVADIDVKKFVFRMDVLESHSGKYLWSIILPFGDSFITMNSTDDGGFTRHQINLDEGYYIWSDVDEEEMDSHVIIDRFQIREE